MKTNLAQAIALVLAGAAPASAANGITDGFSGVFLWVFCGYCAIIIVTQTIAALHSLAENSRHRPPAPAEVESPKS